MIFAALYVFTLPVKADGEVWYESDEGYEVVIDDKEDILSDSEEKKLAKLMQELAEYGNVVFYSTSESGIVDEGEADRAASYYYESLYSSYANGMIFVVDLDNYHQDPEGEGMCSPTWTCPAMRAQLAAMTWSPIWVLWPKWLLAIM